MPAAVPVSSVPLLADPDYLQHQLKLINPLVRLLGVLATLMLALLLPWDMQSESPRALLAAVMRLGAILPFLIMALHWHQRWKPEHVIRSLLLLGLGSYLFLSANYILLPERREYLFTLLFYYNLAFLLLAPLATTLQILLVLLVPVMLMYTMLASTGLIAIWFLPFSLHALPLVLLLNLGAWYVRKLSQDNYLLHRTNVELATHDELTGLYNRRAWFNMSRNLLARARRERGSFAVLLVDIDHFKHINDTHGHVVGDEVLRQLARTLKDVLRDYDVLGRLGGEEFVIAVTGMNGFQAGSLGERLRQAVERMQLVVSGKEIRITISVGLACLQVDTEDLDTLIDQADKAMYEAKHKGRNRVELYIGAVEPVEALLSPAQESAG